MRISNWIIGLVTAAFFAGAWGITNRPVDEQPWRGELRGLSFAPYTDAHNPMSKVDPTPEEISRDLKAVASVARSVRTYTTQGTMMQVPRLAWKQGLTVTAGAWISGDLEANKREIANLIDMTRSNGNITQLIVGNESVLRADVTVPELIQYIRAVKALTPLPVSTAEPWHVWLAHPELAKQVDFIAVHILPFWEGIDPDQAVKFVMERYEDLRREFPDRRIVISEVGWPSEGLTRKDAVASPVNQGLFLRRFLAAAKDHNLDYFVMEAFDQPWKMQVEGGVGAYWGIFDADRHLKPALDGVLMNRPDWPWLSLATLAVGLPFVLWLLRQELGLKRRGRLFLAILAQGTVSAAVWVYAAYSGLYLTDFDIGVLSVIAPATLLLLGIFLTEGIEMVECLWRGSSRRRLAAPMLAQDAPPPMVSIHVPCRNEPADMMIRTIKALERLDYPNFEVLIVDNNSTDDGCWQPVEVYCRNLGANFRFFHLPKWPGFKAGALNFALAHTNPEARIVATIDSDYEVSRDWLKDLVGHFADPQVALVQAPQDYRDGGDGIFKRLCFWEYAGFFHLGMKSRDEHNAIIQHGTMALIRKDALERVGGWAEWCITEDAELGLRLFEAGHRAVYTEKSYGKGLMPDSFDAFRKQRYRWAYGAMQIMKTHWRELLPWGERKLTRSQRYQFVAGWLPWIADGFQLLFVALALVWTAGMILLPQFIEPPLTLFLIVTLGMFAFKVGKSLWLYTQRVPCSFLERLGASLAGLALAHTVAKAVWRGTFTANLPFMRTPKLENQPAFIRGLLAAWEETLIAALLVGSGALIMTTRGVIEPAAKLWAMLLFVQALPFASALLLSMINALPLGQRHRVALPLGAAEQAKSPAAE
jgi:exo-beta-1,3-glucanase (GH17 family)/cellulose synthase/poly-beta-1,6-N-acetylglucosamine synthase-like glycosyltransferase